LARLQLGAAAAVDDMAAVAVILSTFPSKKKTDNCLAREDAMEGAMPSAAPGAAAAVVAALEQYSALEQYFVLG